MSKDTREENFNVHKKKGTEMWGLLTKERDQGNFSNFVKDCIEIAYPEILKRRDEATNESRALFEQLQKRGKSEREEAIEVYKQQQALSKGTFNDGPIVKNLSKKLRMTPEEFRLMLKKEGVTK